jgi:hypothetical protein
LVYSIYDSTEEAIKKMIEANERIMALGGGNGAALRTTTRRLYELQINTLRDAPRDKDKLEWILKKKEKAKKDAKEIEETERLDTEIEMLKIVLYLVNRNS